MIINTFQLKAPYKESTKSIRILIKPAYFLSNKADVSCLDDKRLIMKPNRFPMKNYCMNYAVVLEN